MWVTSLRLPESVASLFPAERWGRRLRSPLARAGGLVLTASVVSGAMNAASIVITIRSLSLEAFGLLTVAITTMQLVGSLSNAGLHEALMVLIARAEAAGQPQEAARSFVGLLWLRLAVTLLVLVGGFLGSTLIAEAIFAKRELVGPLFFGFLGGCAISLAQFSLTALRAFNAFGRYALVVVLRFAALLAAVSLLAVLGRLELTEALFVNAVAPLLTFAVGLYVMPVRSWRAPKSAREMLPRVWDYSKWITAGSLLSMFAGRLEIYLLTAFASASEVGIYAVAFKLAGALQFLQTNIRTVLFPELARRAVTPRRVSFVRELVRLLVILGGLLWAAGLLASLLVGPVLGKAYVGSVPIFLILLAARTILIPLTPLNLLLLATNETRVTAFYAGLQLVALVAIGMALIPTYGAAGAAWTQVLVSGFSAVYLVMLTRPLLARTESPVPRPRP
jgi:O-antigen/teichoic acid export membrane protein